MDVLGPTAALALASTVAGALAITGGLLLTRRRQEEAALAEILGLPLADDRDDDLGDDEHGALAAGTLRVAAHALERWDRPGSLRDRIERADLSLRPAELVVITAAVGIALAVALAAMTGVWWLGPIPLLLAPLGVRSLLAVKARRRASRFAAQLPDALALVAGSLEAGHTFLRSIQLMADELEAPLSDEFGRVVAETQLGTPLVTALERMAERIRLRDVAWMVRAIRIQQSVGGQLAELLATLAEFMRAREELRREIKVLTAEGRMTAWVLGAMPVCLFIAVQVLNPGYVDPLLRGWGLVWLGLTGLSMGIGLWLILRMVDAVEV